MRYLLGILACGCLVLSSCNSSAEPAATRAPDYAKTLAGAPAPLAALHRQSGRFLEGGAPAYRAKLAELRGYPVVVNKWASWCLACRAEFPFFQRQAAKRGKEIAFLGINSSDNRSDAGDFLAKRPVPFPHFDDPNGDVAAELRGPQVFPTTAFYSAKGKLAFVHIGEYSSEKALAEEIERYAR